MHKFLNHQQVSKSIPWYFKAYNSGKRRKCLQRKVKVVHVCKMTAKLVCSYDAYVTKYQIYEEEIPHPSAKNGSPFPPSKLGELRPSTLMQWLVNEWHPHPTPQVATTGNRGVIRSPFTALNNLLSLIRFSSTVYRFIQYPKFY